VATGKADVESLRSVLADESLIRLALLFGSRARDAGRPDSDVDVGIVPRDPELPLGAELDLHGRLERACGAAVDLVRLDHASTLLRWEVARNSVVLAAHPAAEVTRFVAAAALEHADLMTTLGPAVERFRHALARASAGPAGTSRR
jgi:predicted nucleotidyltransferase